jgi:(p)ppGpp synthase/HD superfamily hydrolase
MTAMKTKKETKLRKALLFMIEAHDGQFRKFSGKEYAWHPIAVSKIVREVKVSKNKELICIAALLHDTVEDCDVTISNIEEEFGKMVSSMVEELTSDNNKIEKVGKSEYLLDKMLNMTSYALVIKLADRLHNCSDLEQGSDKFVNKYVTETRFILDGLVSRNLSQTHNELMSLIDFKISPFENN